MPKRIRPRSENQLLGAFIHELGFRDAKRGNSPTGVGLNIYTALDTWGGDLSLVADGIFLIEFKLRRSGAKDEIGKQRKGEKEAGIPGRRDRLIETLEKDLGNPEARLANLSRKGHFLAYGEIDRTTRESPYTLVFDTYLDAVLDESGRRTWGEGAQRYTLDQFYEKLQSAGTGPGWNDTEWAEYCDCLRQDESGNGEARELLNALVVMQYGPIRDLVIVTSSAQLRELQFTSTIEFFDPELRPDVGEPDLKQPPQSGRPVPNPESSDSPGIKR